MDEKLEETSSASQQATVTIDTAMPDDAAAVFDVKRITWLATYPNSEAGITEADIRLQLEGEHGERIPEQIQRTRSRIERQDETRHTFVARMGGQVVGYCSPSTMEGQRRVGAIYVLPEAQGHGIGHLLLDKMLNWWGTDEDIYLHVATYNNNAINFYERHGFVKTGKDATDEVGKLPSGAVIPEIEMVRRAQ
jgi:GNAT superfamily N-acetyltransferase